MYFLPKKSFLTQISKRSTPTDLHHPDLHLAQFLSLESLKIFSAYAKTSLGLKNGKIPPDYVVLRQKGGAFLLFLKETDLFEKLGDFTVNHKIRKENLYMNEN